MSQENVETMQRANALANAKDWEALAELIHPDCEWLDLQAAPGTPEVFQGRDVVDVMAQWTESFDDFHAEVCEYFDADPWVVCDTRWSGKGKGSGMAVDARIADTYEIRDGMIVRAIVSYSDLATALEAVGLRE